MNHSSNFTADGPDRFWEPWLSTGSTFCQALVGCGILTGEQMLRAASRYHLGMSRGGGVIFWQIDAAGRTRDGKIMHYLPDCHRDKRRNPAWCSDRLKRYYGYDGEVAVERCLFGLHLLGIADSQPSIRTIAVVEAEKTAVICSERFPEYTWMAAGGLSMLSADKLRPLKDHRVVLFPDTDPKGEAFRRWSGIAREASPHFLLPIYVSPLLEQRATPEQKQRKIDIADLILER